MSIRRFLVGEIPNPLDDRILPGIIRPKMTKKTKVIIHHHKEKTRSDSIGLWLGVAASVLAILGFAFQLYSFLWARFPGKISAVFSWILTAFDWILAVFVVVLDIRALLEGAYDYKRKR